MTSKNGVQTDFVDISSWWKHAFLLRLVFLLGTSIH